MLRALSVIFSPPRIANSGWWLVESVPEIVHLRSGLEGDGADRDGSGVHGVTVMVLILVILGSILTRHMTFLISKVTEAAASVEADGRDSPDLGVLASNYEFAQLALVFRSMEERVRLKTAELVRKNEELWAAKEETDQAMKQQEIFLSNVAHDLRTPLTIVIGYSEALLLRKARKKNQDAFIPDLAPDRQQG